jgi:hypothetical protein
MMEWMSRILVGEIAGADEEFGLEVGKIWMIFVHINISCDASHLYSCLNIYNSLNKP